MAGMQFLVIVLPAGSVTSKLLQYNFHYSNYCMQKTPYIIVLYAYFKCMIILYKQWSSVAIIITI